jgi:hypothetical protein
MRSTKTLAVLVSLVGYSFMNGCASGPPDDAEGDSGPGRSEAGSGSSSGSGSGSGSSSGAGSSSGTGSDAGTDAAVDAPSDAVPPGTVSVSSLDEYMTTIASGAADKCTHADGHDFCAGSCSGTCAGSKTDSTLSVQTKTATPSLSGASTRVDVSGASTDTLEWVKLDPAAKGSGAYADDTHFRWELDFYPTTLTDVQAYEFDLFFSSNGWWLMMGTQCDLVGGNWNGWNQATGHWIPSSVADCGSFFEVGAWNHVVMTFHRDPGPVTSATRYYYDSLEVNGVSHTWGLDGGFTGTNKGWGDVVGIQVQQDLRSSFASTLASYYDNFTLSVSP